MVRVKVRVRVRASVRVRVRVRATARAKVRVRAKQVVGSRACLEARAPPPHIDPLVAGRTWLESQPLGSRLRRREIVSTLSWVNG